MTKKKKKNLNWIPLSVIALVLTAGIIVFFIGFNNGWFSFSKFYVPIGINKNSFKTLSPGDCTLEFDQEKYCENELMFATLTDGKNARCVVGQNYNNKGWELILAINTTADGTYSDSANAGKSGLYTYAVICLDENNILCRTNDVDIVVEVCPEDGETYTCGWVGTQCGGTCPSTHPMCIDMWKDNLLGGGYSFCACINPDDETVHPDWKPDGIYHDDSGYPDGESACQDTDPTQDVYLSGTCTPIGGTAESDYCPTSTAVTQMWCSNDGLTCMGASNPCPTGEMCEGGVCVKELEYKDNIDPSEAIPGLIYGEEDFGDCVEQSNYVSLCKQYVDPEVDSAHCEPDTTRMIDCSEGWNNCGGGDGEGEWYCCNFQDVDSILNDHCCGDSPFCDVVCERWYQAGV